MIPPLVIGVAGGSGSGKSTVVREIVAGVSPEAVSQVHHDAYYRDFDHLTEDERARINFDHPDALETELLVRHVDALRAGVPIEMPVYDFRTHTRREETIPVHPTRIVLVDGILVLAEPELRERMDVRVYVDTDPDVRLIRRLRRDVAERGRSVESVLTQYETTVRPMHRDFVEPSKRWADIIIPEGGHNKVAVDMLATKMASILAVS
ncbi:MAG: uridine kinase [Longimicrobiales bacterium]